LVLFVYCLHYLLSLTIDIYDELTGGRASSSCCHRVDIFPNGVSYDGCIYGVMGLCGCDYKTCMKGP